MSYKHKGTNGTNVPKTNIKSGVELFSLQVFASFICLGFAVYCWSVDAIVGFVSSLLFGLAFAFVVLWDIKNYVSDLIAKNRPNKD